MGNVDQNQMIQDYQSEVPASGGQFKIDLQRRLIEMGDSKKGLIHGSDGLPGIIKSEKVAQVSEANAKKTGKVVKRLLPMNM